MALAGKRRRYGAVIMMEGGISLWSLAYHTYGIIHMGCPPIGDAVLCVIMEAIRGSSFNPGRATLVLCDSI